MHEKEIHAWLRNLCTMMKNFIANRIGAGKGERLQRHLLASHHTTSLKLR
jgi:hypothetical protein